MFSPIRFIRAAVPLVLLAGLAACGGGGSSSAIPAAGPNTSSVISVNGSNLTVTGTITALFSGGFTLMEGSPAGYMHVYTNSSTAITGPALYVGEAVIVSGTGSLSTSITATSVGPQSTATPGPTGTATPAPTSAPLGATIALPSGVTAFTGSVSQVGTGFFTIYGGSNYGYFKVYTNSSTAFFGGSPVVGSYAKVTGTGTAGVSMTAVTASFTPVSPSSITVSGQVSASTPYGFTLSSNGTTVPVALISSSVIGGGTLQVGANVSVTGSGTTATSVTAVQIVVQAATPAPGVAATPTPGPIAQTHVLTEDYLGGRYGTHSIAWSQASPYLTYAQTGTTDASSIAATGIQTQFYADPNRTESGSGDPLFSTDETTFAHDCSGNRVTYQYGSVTQYVMDVGGASMQNRFVSYINNVKSQAHFDNLYEDDAGPLSAFGLANFLPSTPCSYSDSQWITNGQAINQVSPLPVIVNGLSGLNGHNPSLTLGLLDSSNTIGGNYEHCYTDNNELKMGQWEWTAIENTELQVAAKNKLFICQERNLNDASTQTDARIYALASFLLTYNPQNSVLWEEFNTASGLHVFPESQLVALNPRVAAPTDVSGLQQTGGAYGREFANCYIAGKFVSSCAVVVNPDTQFSHTFPFPQYTHTLVLSGSGTIDGGTMSTGGGAPPTTLGPSQAAIVFP